MSLQENKLHYFSGKLCPACNASDKPKGGILIKRNGKFGQFLGCKRYPDCNFSVKIDTDLESEAETWLKKGKKRKKIDKKLVRRELGKARKTLKTIKESHKSSEKEWDNY